MIEMANICAKLLIQYNFKYQLTFLVLTNKNGEVDKILSEKRITKYFKYY